MHCVQNRQQFRFPVQSEFYHHVDVYLHFAGDGKHIGKDLSIRVRDKSVSVLKIFSNAELECELNSMKVIIPECMTSSDYSSGNYTFLFGERADASLCPTELSSIGFIKNGTEIENVVTIDFEKSSANASW